MGRDGGSPNFKKSFPVTRLDNQKKRYTFGAPVFLAADQAFPLGSRQFGNPLFLLLPMRKYYAPAVPGSGFAGPARTRRARSRASPNGLKNPAVLRNAARRMSGKNQFGEPGRQSRTGAAAEALRFPNPGAAAAALKLREHHRYRTTQLPG